MRIVLIGGVPFPTVNIICGILEKYPSAQIFALSENFAFIPSALKANPNVTLWQGTAKDKTLVKNLLSNAQILISMLQTENLSQTESIENYISSMSNLLDFSRNSEIERIIHISSSRVYGAMADCPVTEENPTKPTDIKGVMDALGEKLAYYYSVRYSLPIVILRMFNLYGPYEPSGNTVPLLIKSALGNNPLQLWKDGEQTENLLFVDDFAGAVYKILKAKFEPLKGEFINIGGFSSIPVKTIANIILSKLNKPQSLITYEENNNHDYFNLAPSIMKAKILLSWSPKTEIETGLEKTIDWYIKNRDWWDIKG